MSGSNAAIAERGIMPPLLYCRPNAGGNIQAWMADNAENDELTYVQLTCLHGEGIVSKRRGSPYRSGRTDHWLKIKNPVVAPAVKREAEEGRGC
jgi:ATP-dependent DNA ligase